MKRILMLTVICFLLTACNVIPTQTQPATIQPTDTTTPPHMRPSQVIPTPTETTEQTWHDLNIYVPNENYDGFSTIPTMIDRQDPNLILEHLIQDSILEEEIELNHFEITDGQIKLDFNQAFLDQLVEYGTSGENMMIGCVVNTYLYVYDAETVFITVNNEIMESGHVVYDFPMSFME